MTESQWKLGRFTRVVERKDGTHRVSFTVPPQFRPSNWRSSIILPEFGVPDGSLTDPAFKRRVMADAARLNGDLDRRRAREELLSRVGRRRIPELAELVYRSEQFTKENGPDAQYRLTRDIKIITRWSASRGHPDWSTIDEDEITQMLEAFQETPFARMSIRSAWNVMGNCAVAARWRPDNPAANLNWKAPRPAAVHPWSQEVVNRYAEKARALGQPGLAALIEVQFFVGQRLGDARLLIHGDHYDEGRIDVRQSKTEALAGAALPSHLRDRIEQARVATSPYLFNDGKTGLPFLTHSQLDNRFVELRHSLLKEGDPVHVLRTLRHAAVCEMAKRGLTSVQIATRTGHKIDKVENILLRYLIDRDGVADASAVQQHIASGGSADDFILVLDRAPRDRLGDTSKLPYYKPLAPKVPKKRGRPRKTPAPTPQWIDAGLSDKECLEWAA